MEYRELRTMQEWGGMLPDVWASLDPRERARMIAFTEIQNKMEAYNHYFYKPSRDTK